MHVYPSMTLLLFQSTKPVLPEPQRLVEPKPVHEASTFFCCTPQILSLLSKRDASEGMMHNVSVPISSCFAGPDQSLLDLPILFDTLFSPRFILNRQLLRNSTPVSHDASKNVQLEDEPYPFNDSSRCYT